MSNATILQNHNEIIGNNNNSIDELIESINNLPEAGSGEIEITLQEKTITPSTSQQNVVADSNYTGLSKVVVNAVTSAIDSDIKATNIRSGVEILGVTGTLVENEDLTSELNTYETYLDTQEGTIEDIMSALQGKGIGGGITPTGEITITENGSYDVTEYETAKVNVASSGVDNTYWNNFINNNLTSFENSDLTSIASYGLAYKSKLTSISLPNVTTVADRGFMSCTSCTSINLPALKTTGTFIFNGMTALEEVVLPEVTNMSHNCFVSCSKIKKVDFHKITYFGFSIFSGCTNFETLIIRTPSVAQMGSPNLLTNTKIAKGTGFIYVPDDLVDTYKANTNWSNFASQIKGLSELEV